jgi:hypothetical protein
MTNQIELATELCIKVDAMCCEMAMTLFARGLCACEGDRIEALAWCNREISRPGGIWFLEASNEGGGPKVRELFSQLIKRSFANHMAVAASSLEMH